MLCAEGVETLTAPLVALEPRTMGWVIMGRGLKEGAGFSDVFDSGIWRTDE